jgi:formate dehydrogenase major subunit
VPGLGTSFGRGGATTAQQDLANADCILIEGSSMAEAHPVGFRWVTKAKEKGQRVGTLRVLQENHYIQLPVNLF